MELKTDNIIYHTETQEDYDDLMVRLKKLGCMWLDGGKLNGCASYWKNREQNTCVQLKNKRVAYAYKDWYKRNYPEIPIVKYKSKERSLSLKNIISKMRELPAHNRKAWLKRLNKEFSPKYVVTDGNRCYFSRWDEVQAAITVDNMVGYEEAVKRFTNKEEAESVAEQLGWQVKEVEK